MTPLWLIPRTALATLCLCASAFACAYEPESLTQEEVAKEVAIAALFVVDALQTSDIKNHKDTLHEGNPLLGKYPSDAKIAGYFLGAFALQLGATYLLPQKYRSYLQDGTIAVELVVIGNNKRLGLSLNF